MIEFFPYHFLILKKYRQSIYGQRSYTQPLKKRVHIFDGLTIQWSQECILPCHRKERFSPLIPAYEILPIEALMFF